MVVLQLKGEIIIKIYLGNKSSLSFSSAAETGFEAQHFFFFSSTASGWLAAATICAQHSVGIISLTRDSIQSTRRRGKKIRV